MQEVLNICKSARQVRDTGLAQIYTKKFKKLRAYMKIFFVRESLMISTKVFNTQIVIELGHRDLFESRSFRNLKVLELEVDESLPTNC